MKGAIAFAVVVVLACLALSEAGFVPPAATIEKLRFDQAVSSAGKPCKCMSRQACNGGEVNSDVQCHPSYAFVCCVIPDPEFNIMRILQNNNI